MVLFRYRMRTVDWFLCLLWTYTIPGCRFRLSSQSGQRCCMVLHLMQSRCCDPHSRDNANRVELYEPSTTIYGRQIPANTKNAQIVATSEVRAAYERVKSPNIFGLWLNIARHQWRRTKYRILIRDPSSHWFFLIGRAAIGMGRFTIFAWASTVMGGIILMPVPDDQWLFILLIFTTIVPRQFWPAFWTNGNRGADLVVFVNSVQLAGLDDDE